MDNFSVDFKKANIGSASSLVLTGERYRRAWIDSPRNKPATQSKRLIVTKMSARKLTVENSIYARGL